MNHALTHLDFNFTFLELLVYICDDSNTFQKRHKGIVANKGVGSHA